MVLRLLVLKLPVLLRRLKQNAWCRKVEIILWPIIYVGLLFMCCNVRQACGKRFAMLSRDVLIAVTFNEEFSWRFWSIP